MRSQASAVLVLVLVVLGACTQRRQREPLPPLVQTTVEVRNQNFLDVNIYVSSSAQRIRLGTVGGTSTRTFVIPPRVLQSASNLRFEMHPIGANPSIRPQDLYVSPGQRVILTVPAR